MDYIMIYNTLIERGKSRARGKGYHRHRIIPGYQGGQYIPENITYLSRQEHRLVHRLRWKIYGNPADMYAYKILEGKNVVNMPLSEEHKRKISLGGKGRPVWNKGKHYKLGPASEEHKRKNSEAKKGKPAWNKGKIGCYTLSEEHKEKIRQSMINTRENKFWSTSKKQVA